MIAQLVLDKTTHLMMKLSNCNTSNIPNLLGFSTSNSMTSDTHCKLTRIRLPPILSLPFAIPSTIPIMQMITSGGLVIKIILVAVVGLAAPALLGGFLLAPDPPTTNTGIFRFGTRATRVFNHFGHAKRHFR
jgi:hypothetical protein